MKILGICASPRGAKSTTMRLVEAVLEGAKAEGAEIELVDVCKLDIEYCNACQVCFKTGECVHKDDFQGLYDKILAADGLVWGSPNYFHTVTAQMKTLIDRMADAIHCQLLTGKYCCSVASGGNNFDQVTSYLDALMVNFGAFVTGSVGAQMSKGPGDLEAAQKRASSLGKLLAGDIRLKRDYIEQRELQEDQRKYFQNLVKMNKESWEHEYEYWNRLNWN
ncbi:Iron-sulfur flavoprotein [uncultured archaeon]|nr:Iron-sulfur flavoprotein [uncultured archaeon]